MTLALLSPLPLLDLLDISIKPFIDLPFPVCAIFNILILANRPFSNFDVIFAVLYLLLLTPDFSGINPAECDPIKSRSLVSLLHIIIFYLANPLFTENAGAAKIRCLTPC